MPLAVLLLERSYVAALCVLVIAGVSDGLDGFLAKTFDWRTRLGGLLDPAADKLLLVTAFCSLTYVGLTPLDLTGRRDRPRRRHRRRRDRPISC